jgi:hypothetical protein
MDSNENPPLPSLLMHVLCCSANGWNTEVLQQMISKCKNVPVEEPPNKACAALAPSYNRRRGDDCVLEGVIPNEKVGAANSKPVKYLPGCVSDKLTEYCSQDLSAERRAYAPVY